MSTLISIIDKVNNCGGSTANTGKLGCLQVFGTPLSVILTKKGYVIPKETDFTLAFLQTEVQNGNLIPLIEASSFEDMSSEDTFSTNAAGVERLNLQGLPKYKFMFEEGHEFYRQLSKLTSFKSKGAILIDDSGRWLFGVNADGDYIGLTIGQINAEIRKTKVQGGDAESKSVTMQFLDRLQWDLNYGIIERDLVGFTPSDVPTVNGVNIAFSAVPADADTTIEVEVLLSSDNSSVVEGLLVDDFLVQVNGSTVTPSLLAEATPGNYTLTLAALATSDVVTVDLISGNYSIIVSEDVLYRADILGSATVSA
jgi:hypothetical protein